MDEDFIWFRQLGVDNVINHYFLNRCFLSFLPVFFVPNSRRQSSLISSDVERTCIALVTMFGVALVTMFSVAFVTSDITGSSCDVESGTLAGVVMIGLRRA